jgi:ABC-type multidrug transport system ATPase subunit
MKRIDVDEKYEEIVEFAGIPEFMDTPVKRYSSGMYARLGFSVAAHVDPEVLLIDEVLSVGDLAFQRKCIEAMQNFKAKGTTIIFVSHNLHSVSALCDRCLTLNKGEIIYDGSTGEGIKYYYDTMSSNTASGSISIDGVRCLTEDGEERVDLVSGTGITLSMMIDSKDEYPNVWIGIFLTSSTLGLQVFHTTTARLNNKSFALQPGHPLRVSCHLKMNLSPGRYLVGVHVYDYDKLKYIYTGNIANIVIAEDPGIGGIANLEPRLQVEAVR